MKEYQSLSHTRWDCKYHVVFIPKRRKKQIFGALRRQLGEIFRELAQHKESVVVEGHLMPDHVHMCLSIPPKYAVSNVVGYIKGKSAITIARQFGGRERNFTGEVFWARGYFVSTVGLDEADGPRIHPESGGRRRAVRPDEAGRLKFYGRLRAAKFQATGFPVVIWLAFDAASPNHIPPSPTGAAIGSTRPSPDLEPGVTSTAALRCLTAIHTLSRLANCCP